MAAFSSVRGIVTSIEEFWSNARGPSGCEKLMSVRGENGALANFVVTPNTYFVDYAVVRVRDSVIGFYDPNVPTPMIFPPQYRALVVAKPVRSQMVVVDSFDARLISSDGSLQLNITRFTRVQLTNGQPFTGTLGGRNLVAVYQAGAQAISPGVPGMPKQVTPVEVIVLCGDS